MSELTLKEFTPADPETCEHKNKRGVFVFMAGTVAEMCTDCMKQFDERPMTDEEADQCYGEDEDE